MFPKTNFDSSSDKKPTKVIVQFRHLEDDASFKKCRFEGRKCMYRKTFSPKCSKSQELWDF